MGFIVIGAISGLCFGWVLKVSVYSKSSGLGLAKALVVTSGLTLVVMVLVNLYLDIQLGMASVERGLHTGHFAAGFLIGSLQSVRRAKVPKRP